MNVLMHALDSSPKMCSGATTGQRKFIKIGNLKRTPCYLAEQRNNQRKFETEQTRCYMKSKTENGGSPPGFFKR